MSFHTGKANQSSIQQMLYPEKKQNFNFHQHELNIKLLDAIQENNKQQQQLLNEKIEKEKNEKPYKLKQFQNVPSRLEEQCKEWVKREAQKRKLPVKEDIKEKIIRKSGGKNEGKKDRLYEGVDEKNNMFNDYYQKKIKEYKEKGLIVDHYSDQPKESSAPYDLEYEQLLKEKYELEKQLGMNSDETLKELKENVDNKVNPPLSKEQVQTIPQKDHKDHIKTPIPKRDETGLILPKIERNYLKENIESINKIKRRSTGKIEAKTKHKDYGKVPEYLKKYEMEEKQKKEYEKEQKAKKNLPPGTRLLTDEERIETLNGLIKSKKELETVLEKLPITTRTLAMQQKKQEILNKLADVEKGIDQFSRQKVYVRID